MPTGWQPLVKICDPLSNNPCDFADFMTLIKNGITNLVLLSTLFVVFMLVYVGYLFLTSGGSKSQYDRAKQVMGKVILGYLWILGAWLIVYTIVSTLLSPSVGFLLGVPTPNP